MGRIKNFFKENISYIVVFIIMMGIIYIRLPYYIMIPGGTIDISDKVILSNGHKLNGKVNMLYASEVEATIPTYLFSLFNDKWDLFKNEERMIGNESLRDVNIREKLLLENSVDNAIYASYKLLDYDIDITDVKDYVIGKSEDSTCDFVVGDIITYVNDIDINSINLNEYIDKFDVGDIINFRVISDGVEVNRSCSVGLVDGLKKLGVVLIRNFDYKLDGVDINFSGREGGSSGGFMMSLSIYLSLSDEDILKGRVIAGTGTIDSLGNVGEIGGVKYKIIGAYRNNIELVFVPYENYDEAIYIRDKYKYDMDIVKVKSLQDAVDYLRSN